MNDLIGRQAAIDLFPNDALEWDTNCGYIAPHFARRMIDELPSAQIIRCKDCHWHYGTLCRKTNTMFWNDDDFCSHAEREDE